jgi:uncharacterized membrane protein YphA (DoxX/SURF4 family)
VSTVATVAAIALGIAFVVAGGSKLAAGRAWPEQARELGAPMVAVPFVPWIELAVGALLVVRLGGWVPAAIAIGMLVVFTALLALRLAQGRRPPCACFGTWSAKPLGPGHLARNGALLGLGVLALFA